MVKVKYASYTQISPERDVTGSGFSRGQINFKMNMDSMSRWNPYKSYIRMRVRLSKINDNPLDLDDGIAPNMFQGDTFWQQMNAQCNGVKVSEIDDYVGQVASLRQRYALPESRRKEFLSGTNFAQADIDKRINEVSVNGIDQENTIQERVHPGNQASTIAYTLPSMALSIADLNAQALNARNLDAADTIQILAGAASTARWVDTAGADLVDIRDIYRVGDIVNYQSAGPVRSSFVIVSFVDALNANIAADQAIANSAATAIGAAHSVIRHYNPYENGGDIVGVNTLFLTELEVGDRLLNKDTNEEHKVITVTDNLNITVYPPPRTRFIATANWCRIRRKQSRRVKDYELIYKPSLGLFTIDDYLPGNWKIELTPHTNLKFQRYAIESLLDKTPDVDYKLDIIDLQLYIWKGRVASPHNGMEDYDFTELRCQAQTITSASLLNKAFVVNKNSHTFTIAYQKPDAGDDTRFSKTKFRMLNDFEKRISRYQLRINGETLPTPLPQIDTDAAANRDFATQQYYEQLNYNGTIYLDEPEGLKEWFERGPYYSYRLPKKLGAESNRLYVSQEFSITPPENFLLLVFDHYYSGFKLHLQNGLVSKCEKNRMIN